MPLSQQVQEAYTRLLRSELRVAMGCTEPIAIAYCAAYARRVLDAQPQRYTVWCSGNVIKNVKAVTVPGTGGLKGIKAAVLAGVASGRDDLELEVLAGLSEEGRAWLHRAMESQEVAIKPLHEGHMLHIVVELAAGNDVARVEIVDSHTGIGEVTRNGEKLRDRCCSQEQDQSRDRSLLNVRFILQYAGEVELDTVAEVLEKQVECNCAMSAQGLENPWGEQVGDTLCQMDNPALYTHLKAATAAGSDARMNGCALPVVINSGSGNQGLTASLPVIEYVAARNLGREKLLRALCVSNLVAIHQKTGIGYLSAYCGAVCAATGSAAAIAWLDGQSYQCVADTITNAIVTIGGMVCDGAKSSCAAKIAAALDSALTGYEMAKRGRVFRSGEGLVKGDVDATIACVGRMACRGMEATDREILEIMLEN